MPVILAPVSYTHLGVGADADAAGLLYAGGDPVVLWVLLLGCGLLLALVLFGLLYPAGALCTLLLLLAALFFLLLGLSLIHIWGCSPP